MWGPRKRAQETVMGTFRILLALAVAASHTGFDLGVDGRAAVCLFYVISGFYMSLILNQFYTRGAMSFYASRALRLYIPYAVILAATLVAYALLGVDNPMFEAESVWAKGLSAFANVFIIGQDLLWLFGENGGKLVYAPYLVEGYPESLHSLALIAPAFTIAIEAYFYLVAPYFVRSLNRVRMVLAASIAYYAVTAVLAEGRLDLSYHWFFSAFLYFSAGAWIYHLSVCERKSWHVIDYGLLAALAGAACLADITPMWSDFLLTLFAVPILFRITKNNRIDRLIGDLSYGVYLAHWPIYVVLRHSGLERGMMLFAVTALFSVLFALFIYLFVEKPLNAFRHRFRDKEGAPERNEESLAAPALRTLTS